MGNRKITLNVRFSPKQVNSVVVEYLHHAFHFSLLPLTRYQCPPVLLTNNNITITVLLEAKNANQVQSKLILCHYL